MGFSLPKLLEGLGITPGDAEHIQMGAGVVGNTTTAIVAAIIGTAAEAYFLHDQPAVMFGVMGVTLILVLVYLLGTWRFADKHPDLALMGGSDLLQLRQLQMGAKDKSIVIDAHPSLAIGSKQTGPEDG